ncbi:hypothetical protein Poli38472_009421 [Pythium oligandrum]|uniref:BSD domain-containing protein n=1 Tax=Pythium oligandrum TaxID=41045 RepID=A0A8K1CLH5_PYTOL|nr:hypothetical protein Poli38472_009421 [Pythium oligandrum]|eukprot:TMW65254.1 hypothetical protein Poli38472_009421 [Pythium oligandrum]
MVDAEQPADVAPPGDLHEDVKQAEVKMPVSSETPVVEDGAQAAQSTCPVQSSEVAGLPVAGLPTAGFGEPTSSTHDIATDGEETERSEVVATLSLSQDTPEDTSAHIERASLGDNENFREPAAAAQDDSECANGPDETDATDSIIDGSDHGATRTEATKTQERDIQIVEAVGSSVPSDQTSEEQLQPNACEALPEPPEPRVAEEGPAIDAEEPVLDLATKHEDLSPVDAEVSKDDISDSKETSMQSRETGAAEAVTTQDVSNIDQASPTTDGATPVADVSTSAGKTVDDATKADVAFPAAPLRNSTIQLFNIAANLASQAGTRLSTVITLPRAARPKSTDETESESSPSAADYPRPSVDLPKPTPIAFTKVVLPWQSFEEDGEVVDNANIRERILEMTVFRRTYIEPASGEEEYIFEYARYKDIIKELLLLDPNLRDMNQTLVPAIVGEVAFWRNFFLRCNAIHVEVLGRPYLVEVKATLSNVVAIASLQRLKREMFLKKQRSAEDFERLRRNFRLPLGNFVAQRPDELDTEEHDLGDLDLDLDGEIEKELYKRRPSRTSDKVRHVPEAP